MAKIRVLVVEDSLTIRKRMLEVLAADPEIDIVGEADDGKRGIELCQQLRPDVVTLDMMWPVMNGLAATEFIMAYCPTPILIVSASTNRRDLFKTYEALAAGALDALDKPKGNELDDVWEKKLVATVKLISRIRVITHPRARLGRMGPTPAPPRMARNNPRRCKIRDVCAPSPLVSPRAGQGRSSRFCAACPTDSRCLFCWSSMSANSSPPPSPSGLMGRVLSEWATPSMATPSRLTARGAC